MSSAISLATYLPLGQPLAKAASGPAPVLPRIAQGDDGAVKECLRRYGRLVYAIARRFLREERDVEDACQDIFVALWRSAHAFDPSRGTEPTFVALVARRRLVDRQRTTGTRPLPNVEPPVEPTTSAETYVDARIAIAALDDCSEEQKRVVLLAAFHGMTHEEIATELSIPLGTVKSHYSRAIQRVKRALSAGEDRS